MPCVDILLATFQGERFLKEQLDSLLNQTFQDFTLVIRDDGSTDGTLKILEEYEKKDPRIKRLDSEKRLGAAGNFNALLEYSSADFIFFSDQDDVWEKTKMEKILASLLGRDPNVPLLVHTDLEVVDESLNPLHTSFWQYSNLDPEKGNSLNRLLVQNHATGCAMAINRSLKNLASPIPKEAIMHDWWLSLTASTLGTILHRKEKTVLYRQHSKNTIGAHQISFRKGLFKLFTFISNPHANTENALLKQRQANALYNRFQKIIPQDKLELLKTFLSAPEMSLWKRKKTYLTSGFYRQGIKKILPYLFQHRPF